MRENRSLHVLTHHARRTRQTLVTYDPFHDRRLLMDTLTRDDLKYLAETENGWHVSLFMPAYPAGADTAQNPIRFHNLLR